MSRALELLQVNTAARRPCALARSDDRRRTALRAAARGPVSGTSKLTPFRHLNFVPPGGSTNGMVWTPSLASWSTSGGLGTVSPDRRPSHTTRGHAHPMSVPLTARWTSRPPCESGCQDCVRRGTRMDTGERDGRVPRREPRGTACDPHRTLQPAGLRARCCRGLSACCPPRDGRTSPATDFRRGLQAQPPEGLRRGECDEIGAVADQHAAPASSQTTSVSRWARG
jgi:hypothetical protein